MFKSLFSINKFFQAGYLSDTRNISMSLVDGRYLKKLFAEMDEKSVVEHFLSQKEKEIFGNFKYPKRKIEWLAGRIAAKHAAMQMDFPKLTEIDEHPDFFKMISKEKWQNKQVEVNKNGRPSIFSAAGSLDISISHSKDLAVAMAVFDHKCGVDVQLVDPKILKVKSKFVKDTEFAFLKEATAKIISEKERLTLLWSAKEALRKAYEIRPLLGFLEVNLVKAVGESQSGFDFLFYTQRKVKSKEVFAQAWTKQRLYQEYVVSFTVNDCLGAVY